MLVGYSSGGWGCWWWLYYSGRSLARNMGSGRAAIGARGGRGGEVRYVGSSGTARGEAGGVLDRERRGDLGLVLVVGVANERVLTRAWV